MWQHRELACVFRRSLKENGCIYLYQRFPSASIYHLVCLCLVRLAWAKQRSAPRVLEDHCVNGPRAAHSRVALFKYRHQLLNASNMSSQK